MAFTITGAYTGMFNDLVELVSLFKKGKISSVTSRQYKLEEANQALEDSKTGELSEGLSLIHKLWIPRAGFAP